ncbi:MAG: NUDIX hydrolase [Pseudomonadota bacterium]
MIRRVGEPVKKDRTFKRRPGAYAILERDGALLLTHQMEPTPEFQLPGGGVDPGEQVLPALHREVYEETGWHVGKLKRVGAFRRFTYMPEYDLWAEKVCVVYFGRPTMRISAPLEEGHSAHWMSPVDACELAGNPGDRMFLRHLYG